MALIEKMSSLFSHIDCCNIHSGNIMFYGNFSPRPVINNLYQSTLVSSTLSAWHAILIFSGVAPITG